MTRTNLSLRTQRLGGHPRFEAQSAYASGPRQVFVGARDEKRV